MLVTKKIYNPETKGYDEYRIDIQVKEDLTKAVSKYTEVTISTIINSRLVGMVIPSHLTLYSYQLANILDKVLVTPSDFIMSSEYFNSIQEKEEV